jgi:hypothetical protein
MKAQATLTERVVQALIGPGDKTIERNGYLAGH